MNKSTILLSGSCGFIGANFCQFVLPNYQDKYRFVSIDKLVDEYNINFIPKNHKFYLGDFTDSHLIDRIFQIEKPDYILHMGAESFVDKSLEFPAKFTHTNVFGTSILIEAAVKYKVKRFHYCSTDEVGGQLKEGESAWTETDIPNPRNNYSSSKYAGELLLKAANQTYGLEYTISRGCNTFGRFQPYRNLFPKICINLLKNQTTFLHDEGKPQREYISAIDHAEAMMFILEHGLPNETYNIGTNEEKSNIEMVQIISEHYKIKPILDLTTKRAGQDFSYRINTSKLRTIGWTPKISFQKNLIDACEWYRNNLHFFN